MDNNQQLFGSANGQPNQQSKPNGIGGHVTLVIRWLAKLFESSFNETNAFLQFEVCIQLYILTAEIARCAWNSRW
jgi:hypothetical protein